MSECSFLLLSHQALAAVHLTPPAALPSRVGPSLRSKAFPEGLPDLCPSDQAKVALYNHFFALASTIFCAAFRLGILATLVNPASSHFWQTSAWLNTSSSIPTLQFSSLHACLFGATLKRLLYIAHFHEAFQVLQMACGHTSSHPAHSAPRESVTMYPCTSLSCLRSGSCGCPSCCRREVCARGLVCLGCYSLASKSGHWCSAARQARAASAS